MYHSILPRTNTSASSQEPLGRQTEMIFLRTKGRMYAVMNVLHSTPVFLCADARNGAISWVNVKTEECIFFRGLTAKLLSLIFPGTNKFSTYTRRQIHLVVPVELWADKK